MQCPRPKATLLKTSNAVHYKCAHLTATQMILIRKTSTRRERERETDRQTDRQTERKKQRNRQTNKQTETEIGRDRQSQADRQRNRECELSIQNNRQVTPIPNKKPPPPPPLQGGKAYLEMLLIVRQFPQLFGQQKAGQERIVAGEGDVRLTRETTVGIQPEVGHAQLIKLHPVPALHTTAAELVWLTAKGKAGYNISEHSYAPEYCIFKQHSQLVIPQNISIRQTISIFPVPCCCLLPSQVSLCCSF